MVWWLVVVGGWVVVVHCYDHCYMDTAMATLLTLILQQLLLLPELLLLSLAAIDCHFATGTDSAFAAVGAADWYPFPLTHSIALPHPP